MQAMKKLVASATLIPSEFAESYITTQRPVRASKFAKTIDMWAMMPHLTTRDQSTDTVKVHIGIFELPNLFIDQYF